MRKINLKNYTVKIPDETGKKRDVEVNVRDFVSNALFHPDLKLGGREIILRGKLSDKIMEAEDEILLEEADYKKIKDAFEAIKGFGKPHIELLKRVLEAERVDVKEK